MPQIMKTDVPEIMFLEQQAKVLGDIVWGIQTPHGIHTDIVTVNITVPTQLSILLLLFFEFKQKFPILRDKGH